jgi:magnesium chelatase family protein
MSLAVLYSRAREGIEAPLVTVEVHLSGGLPALNIVGLPEAAVRESKDRVRGALLNAHFEFPKGRITVNLAPADLPKEGGRFDLPIAVGILAASGQVPSAACRGFELIGELALSGELRPIRGVLPVALAARDAGRPLILPEENAAEAALVKGLTIYPARHLLQVSEHLLGPGGIPPFCENVAAGVETRYPDLGDVKGQDHAKRALEIAAAGGHSMMMIGPPGTGKSMLASRLPGILPSMNENEALETASVLSISERGFSIKEWKLRPFRTPHHTASGVALVGGGGNPRPGEISLAMNGVMFLDELPEFDRKVLEVLREPIESGRITISRAARQAEFPARFQLVAAMNPCPCGYLGDRGGRPCRCTEEQVARYRARISGPLLDRIDMHVEVPRVPPDQLQNAPRGESSEAVRARVEACRQRQLARSGCPNSQLAGESLDHHCRLDDSGAQLLARAMEQLHLSARAYHRILRLARTIADLQQQPAIAPAHLAEAINFRQLDRDNR